MWECRNDRLMQDANRGLFWMLRRLLVAHTEAHWNDNFFITWCHGEKFFWADRKTSVCRRLYLLKRTLRLISSVITHFFITPSLTSQILRRCNRRKLLLWLRNASFASLFLQLGDRPSHQTHMSCGDKVLTEEKKKLSMTSRAALLTSPNRFLLCHKCHQDRGKKVAAHSIVRFSWLIC